MYRFLVFPSRPDSLLVVATTDDEAPVALALAPPFTAEAVRQMCRDADIPVRVSETVAGRWDRAMRQARADDKAERGQKQRAREALHATALRSADSAFQKDRSELVLAKQNVDERIRELKTIIRNAKAAAWQGRYMDRKKFRHKQAQLEVLKDESQALQARLGALKQAEKASNRIEGQRDTDAFLRCFRNVAKQQLDKETFWAINRAAEALHKNE